MRNKDFQNFVTEAFTAFSDVDQSKLPPRLKKQMKEFNIARLALFSPVVILIYARLITLIICIPLCYWGYKRYKKLYPLLDRDLDPYRNTKDKNKRT